ncbi:MAG: TIGR03032 family protein [Cyclobacteriaceae bacterium]|nr:TIGR03032 family protein [Cyclobacteriaceae bacterium HetDA_MAG_MS6]
MQKSPPPPFSYQFSPNVPELLQGLGCSLAISTYQTGKVVIFSAQNEDQLVQLPRNFERPMGMAVNGSKWAIALRSEILVTANTPGFAQKYPENPNTYDGLFMPRTSYYTGALDIHDLSWSGDKLLAVNTLFSCIAEMSPEHSFQPVWQPSFVSAMVPEDRCHLNGMTLKDGKPKYVTALGTGDTPRSWKDTMLQSGVLIDVESNENVLEGLPVPHSPRLYDDGLYMLLSATGELVKVDLNSKKYEVLTKLNGFLRGMDRCGDYLFIAMSKLRQGSSLFKDAPIAKDSVFCGISIVYVPTGKQVGYIIYNTSVEELFEVKVLEGMMRPNILNLKKGFHQNVIATEKEVFWSEHAEEKITEQSPL